MRIPPYAVPAGAFMYARNLSIHLKNNAGPEFTRTLEHDVLPVLRKQNGFKDELTFIAPDGKRAVAISLWDRKESAEAYDRNAYAGVQEHGESRGRDARGAELRSVQLDVPQDLGQDLKW